MKALITGISGFAGRHLAALLNEKGYEVHGIDRNGADVTGSAVYVCDVLDREKLRSIASRVEPEAIFHLAAFSSVEKSFSEPELARKVNVEGTGNVLEAASLCRNDPVVLAVSSLQVYGKPDRVPISEAAELRPENPYGESKAEQEKVCLEYFRNRGLKVIIARSFNHTGTGQPADFVWPNFTKQIAEIEKGKRDVLRVGNLDVERDFSDVRDVVRAYELAAVKCRPGEAYNVCSGKPINIGNMLETLKSFSTTDVRVVVDRNRIRKESAALYGDNSKLSGETGWKPEIPFETTLRELLEYWRKRV